MKDPAEGYCKLCAGSGKVDTGNGSTKPCVCVAGLIERHRRKLLAQARRLPDAAGKQKGAS
jgi:hypothetical protein